MLKEERKTMAKNPEIKTHTYEFVAMKPGFKNTCWRATDLLFLNTVEMWDYHSFCGWFYSLISSKNASDKVIHKITITVESEEI